MPGEFHVLAIDYKLLFYLCTDLYFPSIVTFAKFEEHKKLLVYCWTNFSYNYTVNTFLTEGLIQ